MTIPEILQALETFSEKLPREALKAAIDNSEAIAPTLLETLENLKGRFQEIPEDYYLHIYSFFLLAQFRETKAYPLIVDLMIELGDKADEVCSDFITEDLGRVLASVYDGDSTHLLRLMNTAEDEFVRGEAVKTLSILYLEGQITREELVTYLEDFSKQALVQENVTLATGVVIESLHLHVTELKAVIDQLFDADLVDLFFISRKFFEEKLAEQTLEEALQEIRKQNHYQLVNDMIKEMSNWFCFQENKEEYGKAQLEAMEKLLSESLKSRLKEKEGFDPSKGLSEKTAPKYRMNPQKKAKQKQQKQARKKNRSKKK